MGQKVHPKGFRLGIIKTWDSKWFSSKEYAKLAVEDRNIRRIIKEKFYHAGVSSIEIERAGDKAKIIIHTARPGIVIGKKGVEIEALRKELEQRFHREFTIDTKEVRRPELDATLVAENIALQLLRRVAFRRAMKRAVTAALKAGAKGIKVACSGRLGGAEMARYEWYREGRVPLHTIRADIDYGTAIAKTTYGVIGIKVWIFKGEVLP
ncbi:MAG: 30S ribosomal protein S3 [Syntrophobacterales bacterium]|nr:30S ribosomal protein S3 [Syntrophobacterales bacterium]